MDRRGFLALTAASVATPAWSGTGVAFLTAANTASNETFLLALSDSGSVIRSIAIPGRGHAAAVHPAASIAVAFARRPNSFAVILDVVSGQELARIHCPEGRHFYGHGAFSADGAHLLTTENAFDEGRGRIGVYDVANGFRRVDELGSGGVGPHEIIRLSDGFVVANGGIQTHPSHGRAKLNLPSMEPNLTWLRPDGTVQDQTPHGPGERQNSIRHIAADARGQVAIALQWQGNPRDPAPVAAVAQRGGEIRYLDHPETARLKHYGGSVSFSGAADEFGVTGPKGGHLLRFDAKTLAPLPGLTLPVASGLAPFGAGFMVTVSGALVRIDRNSATALPVAGDWSFDNHLVSVV